MKICGSRKLFSFLILLLFQLSATAQPDLQKVIPLTPNAAAIAKYGEIPVGHFTGVPNISLPLWTVKSGELELPLSLSYHAGGNRVEDVASWVGMGWSLSGIPSLSRGVRGLPDETAFGTFTQFDNKSTKQIAELYQEAANAPSWVFNYSMNIIQGNLDTEADMYQFSLLGKSGRFYWDQVTGKYQTNPWSNIKIVGDLNLGEFTITDEDGTIYKFGYIETSQTQGLGTSPEIKTSWQIWKIYNSNKTDSITFGYAPETQSVMSINPAKKVLWGGCPPSGSFSSTQTLKAYTPNSISFENGYIEFTKDVVVRQDLSGGYALKNISISNNQTLLKKYQLTYDYRSADVGDPLCNLLSASAAEKKRLMLRSFAEQAADNSSSLVHYFLYDSTVSSPCRISAAQDFWGYYNGALANQNLVAAGPVSVAGSIMFPTGANRYANPAYSQFGILKRIVYPTGGYTDFVYESNDANTTGLPKVYTAKTAYLAAEGTISGSIYIDTFEINNPSDFYLNNNSSGSFAKIVFGELGYNHTQGMQQAGLLYLRGLDPSNSSINTTISYNLDGYLLPNGRYEMKAVFNQDPPMYENFYYVITWNEVQPGSVNQYVGGLRVKEIVSHDGLGANLKKQYRYTNSLSSETSSGDIFGTTAFLRNEKIICVDQSGSVYGENEEYYFTAAGNATSVSHSGSFVGYKTVYESVDNALSLGVTEHKFSHARDGFVNHEDPFPPTFSMQEFRGKPTQVTHFKNQGGVLYPVSRTINEYFHKEMDSLGITNLKTRTVRPPVYKPGGELELGAPPILQFAPYIEYPVWTSLQKKTEVTFDQLDTTKYLQQVTEYEYSPSHYQLVKTKTTNSKQQQLEVKQFYPPDLALSGDHETARVGLIAKNKISAVLKTEQLNGASHVSTIESRFKTFSPNNMILPDEIWQRIGSGTAEPRVKFISYDASGNLTSQQKNGDVLKSYIWDYVKAHPIAEVINASPDRIAYTSFEADGLGGWVLNPGSSIFETNNAPTGKKVMSGVIMKTVPAGNYTVGVWGYSSMWVNGQALTQPVKSVGSWSYYVVKLNNVTQVEVAGASVDEVRLLPEGAQMNTYTYDPLLGLTSQCDANNVITYYQYDGLGRLKAILDEKRQVIKKIDYQYQKNSNQ